MKFIGLVFCYTFFFFLFFFLLYFVQQLRCHFVYKFNIKIMKHQFLLIIIADLLTKVHADLLTKVHLLAVWLAVRTCKILQLCRRKMGLLYWCSRYTLVVHFCMVMELRIVWYKLYNSVDVNLLRPSTISNRVWIYFSMIVCVLYCCCYFHNHGCCLKSALNYVICIKLRCDLWHVRTAKIEIGLCLLRKHRSVFWMFAHVALWLSGMYGRPFIGLIWVCSVLTYHNAHFYLRWYIHRHAEPEFG